MNRIQVPQGMRDLITTECNKKEELKKKFENIFCHYGYQPIETPAIEYFDVYQNAYEEAKEEDFYLFFDQYGKTLALRSDMTIPIARVCASKFANAKPPFRFRYCSDVFKVRHKFAGMRSQVTDCGIELIGVDSRLDLEVLTLAFETLQAIGKEDYVLEIGTSNFFHMATLQLNLTEKQRKELAHLIDAKSMVDLEQFLKDLSLTEEKKNFFLQLPMLAGKVDILEEAEKYCFSSTLKKEIDYLRSLYQSLKELGYEEHLQFDLSKVPHLDYYTGIIFEGYVSSVGTAVLSGGRYDSLLKKFGRDLPACGFSIKLDSLLDIMEEMPQKITPIYYAKGQEVAALQSTKQMNENENIVLIEKDEETL